MEKLRTRRRAVDSFLCVGLDCEIQKVPKKYSQNLQGLVAFNKDLIEATAPFAAAMKFNLAFYEASGAEGWEALAESLSFARKTQPELLCIGDAKRADIGTTSLAYARALFDELEFDAVTLNPYLGREALESFLEREDRISIIVCRTSNPGSGEFQNLRCEGTTLWRLVADAVLRKWNIHDNCMLVIGATQPLELDEVRSAYAEAEFLVPGIGAQGGDLAAVIQKGLCSKGQGLVINASRSIIFAEDPRAAAQKLRDEMRHLRDQKKIHK